MTTPPASPSPSRRRAEELDAADPLASFRQRFSLPADRVYLDGNSLGAMPRVTGDRLRQVAELEWGEGLISSWEGAGWIDLPRKVGDRIAPLIGASAGEVIVTDSTSINLYKLLAAATALRPERSVILSEKANFPTDLYIAEGLIDRLGAGYELQFPAGDTDEEIAAAVHEGVAVVTLSHVHYRDGRRRDMERLTRAAHAKGALILWDLAHSTGAIDVALTACEADFAVGCGYKFLNGGPGAPAFLFVAERHLATATNPLSGWFGHRDPFAFEPSYRAASGIERFLCGTPPILSMAALDAGLDLVEQATPLALEAKSAALGDFLIDLYDESGLADHGFDLVTPRRADDRGSQICLAHRHAGALTRALAEEGVTADFRVPDVIRFGLTPLYTRFVDLWEAADRLITVTERKVWEQPRFQGRARVT